MTRYRYREMEGTVEGVVCYARRRIAGLKRKVEEQSEVIERQAADISDLVRLLTAKQANFEQVAAMLRDSIDVIRRLTEERNALRELPAWQPFSRN